METSKSYAIIYFMDRKPLKKRYDTAYGAFSDHEGQGCVYAKFFDHRGVHCSSYPSSNSGMAYRTS